jgi:hypothetical protein
MVMPSSTPLTVDDHRTSLYTSCHPVCLVVIIHVTMMYHMVVNHSTTLNITNLQVLSTLFVPITGMASSTPFNIILPPEAHTSPG